MIFDEKKEYGEFWLMSVPNIRNVDLPNHLIKSLDHLREEDKETGRKAVEGDAEAQAKVGTIFRMHEYWLCKGSCYKKDKESSCMISKEWLLLSANQGWGPAEFELATSYSYDLDQEDKKMWMERAVSHNTFQSLKTLGESTEDQAEAFSYLERAVVSWTNNTFNCKSSGHSESLHEVQLRLAKLAGKLGEHEKSAQALQAVVADDKSSGSIAKAHYRLGKLYLKKGNNDAAFQSFKQAAQMGYVKAKRQLGICYLEGIGTNANAGEGRFYLMAAATVGDKGVIEKLKSLEPYAPPEAEQELVIDVGQHVLANPLVDLKEGNIYVEGALKGDPESILWVALHYQYQWVKEESPFYGKDKKELADEEGAKWARLAAKSGYAPAQFRLGECLFEGRHMPKDTAEGLAWIEKAAEQGNGKALKFLADLCWKEYPMDYRKYLQYYERIFIAWIHGDEKSRGDLPSLEYINYIRGYAHEQLGQFHEALLSYRTVVDGKSKYAPEAQHSLGMLYKEGKGTNRDPEQAVKYFKKAVKAEQWDAHCELALMYLTGSGVKKNLRDCFQLLSTAAEAGHYRSFQQIMALLMKQFMENTTYRSSNYRREKKSYKDVYPDSHDLNPEQMKKVMDRALNLHHYESAETLRYLGWCHRDGTVLPKDLKKAAELYEASLARKETAELAEELYYLYHKENHGYYSGSYYTPNKEQFPSVSEKDYIRLLKICVEKGDNSFKARAMEKLGKIHKDQNEYWESLDYYAGAAKARGDGPEESLRMDHKDVLEKLHISQTLYNRYKENADKLKEISKDGERMANRPDTYSPNKYKLDQWAAACARLAALGDNRATSELNSMEDTINNRMQLTASERREFLETINKHRSYSWRCSIQ